MGLSSWTDEQLADLAYMRVVENRAWPEIARTLGKSVAACKARLAVKDGRRTSNGSIPGASTAQAPYEVPKARSNDDAKHLALILGVHRGGFWVARGRC